MSVLSSVISALTVVFLFGSAAIAGESCDKSRFPCDAQGESVVVAKDGTGDFADLQSAVEALTASKSVIRVKPGTYSIPHLMLRESGSEARPRAVVAYDKTQPPVLDFGVFEPGPSEGRNPGINIRGSWWLLEGLTIRNARNGIF